jgi:hypothetical protein
VVLIESKSALELLKKKQKKKPRDTFLPTAVSVMINLNKNKNTAHTLSKDLGKER